MAQVQTERPALTADTLPVTRSISDRLPPMLFLAALFHGLVILGLTFDPGLRFSGSNSLTLDVVLLSETDQRILDPNSDAYLAAVSQSGRGNTELDVDTGKLPEGAQLELEPVELLGDFAPNEAIPEEMSQAIVATRADTGALQTTQEEAAEEPLEASAPELGMEQPEVLPENLSTDSRVTDNDTRELVFGVDTQESDLANYLARWKARVESRGTEYYNRQVGNLRVDGAPVIEVAIGSDGELIEVTVLSTSGDPRIDQAALSVLRHAAPYDGIPDHLKQRYDSLRFRYKFQFELLDPVP